MSRCYLDTSFLYVHLRAERSKAPPALEKWRGRVLDQVAVEGGVISALVGDELAYRLVLVWLREDGVQDPLSAYRADAQNAMKRTRRRLTATWRALDSLSLELQVTDDAVVDRARSLMARPGLAPRDAFHAAHALLAGCGAIASADMAFDRVSGLELLAP